MNTRWQLGIRLISLFVAMIVGLIIVLHYELQMVPALFLGMGFGALSQVFIPWD